ncbi:hypothetical protein MUK42_29957 [Musa troglodytarum]|uniref:Uncharacterized protein n=1 Tax=Musa troglodytarum TaxID=320322 RepID=A0A9E7F3P3_9LILI|nr:hypothetical protein MUK42_29957 [Musa troglodytarum]
MKLSSRGQDRTEQSSRSLTRDYRRERARADKGSKKVSSNQKDKDLEKPHAFIQTKHEEKIAFPRTGFLFNHFLTPKHAVKYPSRWHLEFAGVFGIAGTWRMQCSVEMKCGVMGGFQCEYGR